MLLKICQKVYNAVGTKKETAMSNRLLKDIVSPLLKKE